MSNATVVHGMSYYACMIVGCTWAGREADAHYKAAGHGLYLPMRVYKMGNNAPPDSVVNISPSVKVTLLASLETG